MPEFSWRLKLRAVDAWPAGLILGKPKVLLGSRFMKGRRPKRLDMKISF
jgi:hypothetical protein